MKKFDSEQLKKLLSKTLTEYLSDRKQSANALEKQIGLHIGQIYKAKEGINLPGFEILHAIKSNDPYLNMNWLFTGTGPKTSGTKEYSFPEEFMSVMEQKHEYENKYIKEFQRAEKFMKELEECKSNLEDCMKKMKKPRP